MNKLLSLNGLLRLRPGDRTEDPLEATKMNRHSLGAKWEQSDVQEHFSP